MAHRNQPLRVLLYTRADGASNPGGDGVEAGALAHGLTTAGHRALVATGPVNPAERWDVVHLFNLDRAPELAAFLAAHRGFPGARVILAPVAGRPERGLARLARPLRGVANLVRSSPRPRLAWLPGRGLAALAARVDALHFHTAAEQEAFAAAYPGFRGPAAVVPPPVAWPEPAAEPVALPFSPPFAVAVGRVEPLKNQAWLVASGLTAVLPLVVVGAANPKRPLYRARFARAVAGNPSVLWLGPQPHAQVRALLAAASLHVLASRRENYGLATVEALSVGCEAMVPAHHPVADALADALHIFDLERPETLVAVARAALAGPPRAHRFDPASHDLMAVAAAVLDLYGRILGER